MTRSLMESDDMVGATLFIQSLVYFLSILSLDPASSLARNIKLLLYMDFSVTNMRQAFNRK